MHLIVACIFDLIEGRKIERGPIGFCNLLNGGLGLQTPNFNVFSFIVFVAPDSEQTVFGSPFYGVLKNPFKCLQLS
jgi:hypothetical protein